jgi:hypothetical protein
MVTSKEQWLDEYADRIMKIWQNWETPLGVDDDYSLTVRKQLTEYFDDPLKKELIESSY